MVNFSAQLWVFFHIFLHFRWWNCRTWLIFFFLSNSLNSNFFTVVRCNSLNPKLWTSFSLPLALEVESHLAGSKLSTELELARLWPPWRNREFGRRINFGRLGFIILWLWFCHCPVGVTAILFSFYIACETWSGILPETTLRLSVFF